MTTQTALISGIGGQDGAYLAQALVAKGYRVAGFDLAGHGLRIPPGAPDITSQVQVFAADVTNYEAVRSILCAVAPTELYHLASYSHVGKSFSLDREVQSINLGGTEVLLEAVLSLPESERPRIYNACSSEVFGSSKAPITETTPFDPKNPYARSKAEAYLYGRAMREAHGLHLSHGFMFNHESPLRARSFVTRKLTRAAAEASRGINGSIPMGNLNAARDWGHARDYVEAMWLMLQMPEPDDYVIASGVARPVREFAETAYDKAGIRLAWSGEGVNEHAVDARTGRRLIHVDPGFLRPVDLDVARGDTTKAQMKLGWRPRVSFADLVAEMVAWDCERLETKALAQA